MTTGYLKPGGRTLPALLIVVVALYFPDSLPTIWSRSSNGLGGHVIIPVYRLSDNRQREGDGQWTMVMGMEMGQTMVMGMEMGRGRFWVERG